jgi:diguanylate cyclase (GGDEF)-like protein
MGHFIQRRSAICAVTVLTTIGMTVAGALADPPSWAGGGRAGASMGGDHAGLQGGGDHAGLQGGGDHAGPQGGGDHAGPQGGGDHAGAWASDRHDEGGPGTGAEWHHGAPASVGGEQHGEGPPSSHGGRGDEGTSPRHGGGGGDEGDQHPEYPHPSYPHPPRPIYPGRPHPGEGRDHPRPSPTTQSSSPPTVPSVTSPPTVPTVTVPPFPSSPPVSAAPTAPTVTVPALTSPVLPATGVTVAPTSPRPHRPRPATVRAAPGRMALVLPQTRTVLPLAGSALPSAVVTLTPGAAAHARSGGAVAAAHVAATPPPPLRGAQEAAAGFEHFIQVIPTWVWIVLGVLAAAALSAGSAALLAGRRVRLQSARVAEASAAALTDSLTGVLNRRGFTDAFNHELDRARRYDRPLALAFMDIRGLKTVNDSQGHLAGDRLLKEAAALLTRSARSHDLVGRMGGDELALVLTEQSAAGVRAVVRRLRSQIPVRRAALGLGDSWDLTVGVAIFPEDGDTADQLIAVADRRLYQQRGILIR